MQVILDPSYASLCNFNEKVIQIYPNLDVVVGQASDRPFYELITGNQIQNKIKSFSERDHSLVRLITLLDQTQNLGLVQYLLFNFNLPDTLFASPD